MAVGDGVAACLVRGAERRVDRRGKTRWRGAGPLGCLQRLGQTGEGLAGTTGGCLGRLDATFLGLGRRMGSSRKRVCCLDGCSSRTRPNLTCDARSSQSRGRRTVACCWAGEEKKKVRVNGEQRRKRWVTDRRAGDAEPGRTRTSKARESMWGCFGVSWSL